MNSFVLIVVDMQVDYFDRQPALAEQRERLVSNINSLVGIFRASELPIVWIRQEFDADLSDAFLDMRRDNIRITIAGTDGSRILPELDQRGDDTVIVKKRYSAFFRTSLDEVLDVLSPEAIVLAGINTHACIRMTAIDAFQRDFEVVLAGDCIGSYDQEHHDITMKYLDGRIANIESNRELETRIRAV